MPSRWRTGTSANAACVNAEFVMIRRSALPFLSLHVDGLFAVISDGARMRRSSKTSTTRASLPAGVNDVAKPPAESAPTVVSSSIGFAASVTSSARTFPEAKPPTLATRPPGRLASNAPPSARRRC